MKYSHLIKNVIYMNEVIYEFLWEFDE